MKKKSNSVSLHIDRLVIDGLPLKAGQAAQLQASVQRELTRILQRDGMGWASQSGAVPTLSAPNIQMSGPLLPVEMGRQIAHSVYQSLVRKV
ncbi:MAG: hypothetical protein LAO78_13270 [Acidobacteriia bacterium]|nr:hypothetical protein [Terriglobia bacterium]